ncbi:adenylate kinase 3-like isoform X2 [Lotus japonicus]|uniref:adenylate kinase 3-like isoform X2 n=1 Tax=Lotus japonicus TaxID=34305 RepID=UPI002587C3AF|nr:adenylate kinase 3-like isoform X2 [Lotus japonicus]
MASSRSTCPDLEDEDVDLKSELLRYIKRAHKPDKQRRFIPYGKGKGKGKGTQSQNCLCHLTTDDMVTGQPLNLIQRKDDTAAVLKSRLEAFLPQSN